MTTDRGVVLQALERIRVVEEHARRVDQAIAYLYSLRPYDKIDAGVVQAQLRQVELNMWRQLMTYGISLDTGARQDLDAAVLAKFPDMATTSGFVKAFNGSFQARIAVPYTGEE